MSSQGGEVRILSERTAPILWAGGLWVLIGVLALIRDSDRQPDSVVHLMAPNGLRAGLWIATGLFAIYAAKWRDNWVPLALGLLMVMPTVRVASYGWAWVMSLVPGPPPGYPAGLDFALFHIAMLCWIQSIRRIPQHSKAVG